MLTRCQEGPRIQEGGQCGDSTERDFGQKSLWSGLRGWALQDEAARSGAAEGLREKPVYRRGRPHACQGLQLGCTGLGRAGGLAGRQRVGGSRSAASSSSRRTAGGAWNLADLVFLPLGHLVT